MLGDIIYAVMYRKRSKRTQRTLFVLTYTLVPLLIIAIVTLLVLMIQGYRFSATNNTVYQAGLVQFGTTPNGATVTVDGATLASRTRTRINVSSGQRTIGMARANYVPWQKTVTVEPGSVLWLTYARLVPEMVTTETLNTYASMGSVLAHKDANLLGVLADPAAPSFTTIAAASGASSDTSVSLPQDMYTPAPDQSFAATAWSESARYVMLRQTVGETNTWLVLDRQDETKSVNLSTTSKLTVTTAFFDASDDRYVYILAGNALYQYDQSQGVLSDAIATNVISATCANDGTVIIVSRSASGDTVMSYVSHGQQLSRTLTLESTKPVLSSVLVTYDHRQYVVVLTSGLLSIAQVSLGSSSDTTPVELNVIRTVAVPTTMKTLVGSPNGRFVLARDTNELRSYDFELDQLSTIPMTMGTASLHWLDDYHLLDRVDGKLMMLEFDGGNVVPIVDVDTQFASVLSSDGRYLYCLQKTADGYAVVRAQMIL